MCAKTLADYPDILLKWHDKNGIIKPEDISSGSKKKVWLQCNWNEEHIYDVSAANYSSGWGGCPFCSGRRVCASNCLATVFPEIAKQWHPTKNGNLTPYNVLAKSGKNVWWYNSFCKHEWNATVANRTHNNSNCPYCSHKKVCMDNCIIATHPIIAEEWHHTKNDSLKPSDVVHGSKRKVWWKAKCGHEWKAAITDRCGHNSGCPICFASKGEQKITYVLSKLNLNFDRQHRFQDCVYIKPLRFDFIIKYNNQNYLIEYNGLQHYHAYFCHYGAKAVESLALQQLKDKIKVDYCNKNNIPLLVIPYWEKDNIEALITNFLK